MSGSYDGEEGFRLLDKEIAVHEVSKNSADGTSRRLFYLALPPSVYPSVCGMIRHYCMNKCKPFPILFWFGCCKWCINVDIFYQFFFFLHMIRAIIHFGINLFQNEITVDGKS